MKRGLLITFEGPEGSGKSTQLRSAAAYLKNLGHRVLLTRQPGGTPWGVALRRALLETRQTVLPLAELFLYEADRAQHVADVILPALKKGMIILCDRFSDSTVAYQGYGRGLDRSLIRRLNEAALQGVTPDGTILLDVAVDQGLRRAAGRARGKDRMERAGLAFHRRVQKGFRTLAQDEKHRITVISGPGSIQDVEERVRVVLDRLLKKAGHGI